MSKRESSNAPRSLSVPVRSLPHRTTRELLALARSGLAEATELRNPGMRYATAHLAALRAAAAMISARAVPGPATRRTRIANAWKLLAQVAPDLREWAHYFEAGAGKRSAAEAGIPNVVTAQETNELMRSAEEFISLVEISLGLAYQPVLEGLAS